MSDSNGDIPDGSEQFDQLQSEDTLNDRGVDDVLDEGYSPSENWSAAERYGNTADEQRDGESLDQRMTQEEREDDPYAEEDSDDLDDGEVGTVRAGRLVGSVGEQSDDDTDSDVFGNDVGIDGAGASAEEAAVHIVGTD